MDALLSSPTVVLGVAALAGMIFVIAIAAGARSMLSGRNDVVDRLGRGRGDDDRELTGSHSGSFVAPTPKEELSKRLVQLLKPFSALARPTKSDELSRARLNMIRAGLRGENSFEIFMGLKLFLAPLLTIAFLEFNANLTNPIQFPVDVVLAIRICGFVFFIPH